MRVIEDLERGAVREDVVHVVDGDERDKVARSGREHGELERERVDVRVDVVRYGDGCFIKACSLFYFRGIYARGRRRVRARVQGGRGQGRDSVIEAGIFVFASGDEARGTR